MKAAPVQDDATVASFALERTLPRPQSGWVRPASNAHAGTLRQDRCPQTGWRDDARLLAAVVGAMTIHLVPAAWIVVGRPSLDFLSFALLLALTWLMSTALQITALRHVRVRRASAPLQFAAAATVGAVFSLLFTAQINPYAQRLGLNAVDAWGAGVDAAWNSVLLAVFLVWQRRGRQRHAEASQRLRSVQSAQLAARRALVESQLQAVQARIDPQHFFDTLDAIERLYRYDEARAEALFDELVVFLRAALPSLHGASSVLGREVDLAVACVRMHALASGEAVALDVDADRALLRRAFPPGLLLPLLRGVLEAGTGPHRTELAVRVDAGGIRPGAMVLSITADRDPGAIAMRRTNQTLQSLFGTRASLVCSPPCGQRVTTRIRIDHEHL